MVKRLRRRSRPAASPAPAAGAAINSGPQFGDDVLRLIFEALPAGAQAFTVGRLNKSWHAWSAPRAATLRQERAACPPRRAHTQPAAPLWMVQEAWPDLRRSRLPPVAGRLPDLELSAARAAYSGDLAALEFIASDRNAWLRLGRGSTVLCTAAAEGGHLEAVEWVYAKGCFYSPEGCDAAALGGHLCVLEWANNMGFLGPGDRIFTAAAEGGHVAVLQCLLDSWGFCLFKDVCVTAAAHGHCNVLKWALDQGFAASKWGPETCRAAAGGGHLELLKLARSQGCPWDEGTCMDAAAGGHLHVIKWARRNGCPWDDGTCTHAAASGHLEVLKWAYFHGCRLVQGAVDVAYMADYTEILDWMRIILADGMPQPEWDGVYSEDEEEGGAAAAGDELLDQHSEA